MELKIEYVDINSIKPYKNNAKLHPKEQIEQIKTSIKQFGMNDPIGIWNNEIYKNEFQKAVNNPNIKFMCNSVEGWSKKLENSLEIITKNK